MSITTESLGWSRYPDSRVEIDWSPEQIVLVDMDHGGEEQDVAAMLESMPHVGIILVGKNLETSLDHTLRIATIKLEDKTIEDVILRVCPEVVVTNLELREIDTSTFIDKERADRARSSIHNVSHKFVNTYFHNLLKQKIVSPQRAKTQKCSVVRWTEAAVARSQNNMIGNSQLYRDPKNRWESVFEKSEDPSKRSKIFAEYDLGIGSVGFYAGLISSISGNMGTEQRLAVKLGTEIAAGLVIVATAVEATVKSERLRELAGKAKKFLSSAMVFGLGVNVGLAVGGVLEMGSELVEAVGTELANENEWNVSELESQPMQDEVIVPQPVAESELIGEGVVTQVPEPDMSWEALTKYFEDQIEANGGVNWVNDQGTVSALDDVSKAQVMAHKALMVGDVNHPAISNIDDTESYLDYMDARKAGLIYSGIGN